MYHQSIKLFTVANCSLCDAQFVMFQKTKNPKPKKKLINRIRPFRNVQKYNSKDMKTKHKNPFFQPFFS